MSEIKAPNDRPGAGKTARSASLADQLEAELGDDISPFGRELLQLRREMEEAGEGWIDEEIEEFHRSRSGE